MQIDKKTLRSVFLGVVACILVYWLLHETERVKGVFRFVMDIIAPFLTGAAIAFILNVPMRAIEGWLKGITGAKLRRLIAVLLTLILVLLVLAVVFWLLIPQLVETVQSMIPRLTSFFSKTEKDVNAFLRENPQLMEWVTKNTNLEKLDWAGLAQKAVTMIGNSVSTILGSAFSAIGVFFSVFANAVISLVFAIYCLFQKETLARQGRKLIYAFLPERIADQTVRILRLTNATFSNFFSGQCVEVCILGALFAVGMAVFRMPYIPLISVLVAVTAFIPIIGAWVGCILGAFFILVVDPIQALWFIVLFQVLQQIENNLIYPRVVGTSIGLSGMWVLVAVVVGGGIMGVAGMFLMIPVASVLYTLLSELTHKRLDARQIEAQKLREQPPELCPKFRKKRDPAKEKKPKEKKPKEKKPKEKKPKEKKKQN